MENTIQQAEANAAATVDPPEEILSAKEVAQDIEASPSWVYAHADELGGYRVGRRLWFRWQRIQEDTRKKAKRTQT
jgi:hypothetical protein